MKDLSPANTGLIIGGGLVLLLLLFVVHNFLSPISVKSTKYVAQGTVDEFTETQRKLQAAGLLAPGMGGGGYNTAVMPGGYPVAGNTGVVNSGNTSAWQNANNGYIDNSANANAFNLFMQQLMGTGAMSQNLGAALAGKPAYQPYG